MKAHISDTDTNYELKIRTELLKVKQSGLAIGTKAISQVIYNKATDESKSCEERLEDIIKFCQIGLAIKTEGERNE